MESPASQLEQLTEAVYEAALEPARWGDVMRRMHTLFDSTAETFYLLDPQRNGVRPIHVEGVSRSWLACFAEAYFSPDNPWVSLSGELHQPGMIRTNERLIDYTRDREVLYRSAYYNEWMKPQHLRYTIGCTLAREPGLIANVTLLRAPDMPTFAPADEAAFDCLSRHMRRALRMGLKFDRLDAARAPLVQALDSLPHAVLLLDLQGRALHANAMAEDLLRCGRGLCLRSGRVVAARSDERPALAALLQRCGQSEPIAGAAGPDAIVLRSHQDGKRSVPLTVTAIPLAETRAHFGQGQRAILLMAVEAQAVAVPPDAVLRELYGLTAAETRLARHLAAGDSVRDAAERSGIRYGTARGYLKVLFQKTGTHRQADLAKSLLRQTAPALRDPGVLAGQRKA